MGELYQPILNDDGVPPSVFTKTQLLVDRRQIDEVLHKEVRLKSKNLRIMQMGALAMVKKHQQAMTLAPQEEKDREASVGLGSEFLAAE